MTRSEFVVHDRDVREQLGRDMRVWHPGTDTLFVDELDLGGLVRVDVAAVNGALWGYEIKSARDTLRRLPAQVTVYSKVFDYAALVVADRHHDHAFDLLPEWWRVYAALGGGDVGVELVLTRVGSPNPSVDPWQLVQLLWRDEALEELTARGLDHGVRSKPRRMVWQRLVESVELTELQFVVRSRLKSRQGWRGCL
ncbi:sce7726 family protein [Amycolatopsis xylanica]|uniref:sce7726 family protein n=1 Tax=Amycolatopsis xylanica TaxID=589385 RepID=UPI00115F934A